MLLELFDSQQTVKDICTCNAVMSTCYASRADMMQVRSCECLVWARAYIRGDKAFHTSAITDVSLTTVTPQDYHTEVTQDCMYLTLRKDR